MNESLAAEGVLTSAAPELPLSDGNTIPTALSPVEGEVLGLPAGSAAKPEVKPLYGVAEVPPPRQRALAGCRDYPSAGEALQALMDRGEVRRATILPFPKWQAGQPPSSPAFDH